jgi:2-polyprenyl-6-methoxyphenol hydroxylase-like FAD-dependent oxidoreductase
VIRHHDVLIIGGGLTGLRAALRISDAGLNGAVVSKVHPLRSHSVAAPGCPRICSIGVIITAIGVSERHAASIKTRLTLAA